MKRGDSMYRGGGNDAHNERIGKYFPDVVNIAARQWFDCDRQAVTPSQHEEVVNLVKLRRAVRKRYDFANRAVR